MGGLVLGLIADCFWRDSSNRCCVLATLMSVRIWAMVLGLGMASICRRNPSESMAKPMVTRIGCSKFTIAAGLLSFQSGHSAQPTPYPVGVLMTNAVFWTQIAWFPSFVEINLKLDEVA